MKTQEEIKTPLCPAKELEYKAGEVVTKEIFSNGNGSVTLLAFAGGAMLARHSVPFDVFVYVMEGAVEFEVEDQRQHLDADDAILLPANSPHTVLADWARMMPHSDPGGCARPGVASSYNDSAGIALYEYGR